MTEPAKTTAVDDARQLSWEELDAFARTHDAIPHWTTFEDGFHSLDPAPLGKGRWVHLEAFHSKVAELEAQLRQEREAHQGDCKIYGMAHDKLQARLNASEAQVAQLQVTVGQLRDLIINHADVPLYLGKLTSYAEGFNRCNAELRAALATCSAPKQEAES